MTDTIEQLVRDAGDRPVPALDVEAVHTRARHRRATRRARRGVLVALAVAFTATVVVLAASGSGRTARRVDTTNPPPTFTRTPGIPDAYQIGSIATDGHAYVATGSVDNPASTPTNRLVDTAIWYSADGQTWRVAYSVPPPPVPKLGGPGSPPPAVSPNATIVDHVISTPHGFVAWGTQGVAGMRGDVAAVWQSADGLVWTQADVAQFLPTVGGVPSTIGSAIYGLIERGGALLGVGEIYTHSKAPDGGKPCLWTSADGLHWSHRLVDVGAGFDPYFNGLATRGDLVVTSGRIGKYPATSWTSRDLARWKRTTISAQAGGYLVDTAQGLFVIGSLRHGASLRDQKTRPAIWRSRDGRRWQRVLTLPTGTLTYFTSIGSDGSRLVALGSTLVGTDRAPRPFVYTSTNGTHWRRVRLPLDVFPRYTSLGLVTVIDGRLTIAGSIASNGGPLATSTPYFWRATG